MNLLSHRSSYAIALCLLGKSAVFAPTAFAAPIDTYPGFLSADEVEHFASSVDVDKEGIWHEANKGRGVTTFDPALFERLLDVTGTQLTAEEQHQMQYLRSIPVTKITGNTHVHVDRHHDSGEPVEGKAAFIVLNENPHATFVHGSTDVHAKAGDLVVFDADVPHNTQVARGALTLVGPVDLRRLTPVGGSAPSPAPVLCPQAVFITDFCDCEADGDCAVLGDSANEAGEFCNCKEAKGPDCCNYKSKGAKSPKASKAQKSLKASKSSTVEECPPKTQGSDSCEGGCGGTGGDGTGGDCFCTPSCVVENDCCTDAEFFCGVCESSGFGDQ